MKRVKATYKYIFIAFILIGLNSCEDFLEENPKNFISPENFYENRTDIESALAGVYANYSMHIWSNLSWYHLTKINTDDNENSFPFTLSEPGFIDNASDNGDLDQLWNWNYEGIKRANEFLFRVEDLDNSVIPSDMRDRMMGEAKFFRALSYYFLASLFGDVPLVVEPYNPQESPLVTRDEAEVVWDFISEDLKEAVADLPPKSDYSGVDVSRINQDAARMLIAKIAMIQNDWAEAKQYVDEVIASGEYALEEDITEVWDLGTEHGIESIFEVNFEEDMVPNLGNVFHNHTAPPSARSPLTGEVIGGGKWGGASYNQLFYNSFPENDDRKLKLFWDTAYYDEHVDGRYYTTKYWDFETMDVARGGQGRINLVYFRYADLLLMKAEIENEINNAPNPAAYDAINQVRNRSNVPSLEPGLNYDQFLHEVFDERSRELFYEGHHWLELKRRDFSFVEQRVESKRRQFFDEVGFAGSFDFQEYMLLFPIPQAQRDANPKLEQNLGY